jgi:hypothetical protein
MNRIRNLLALAAVVVAAVPLRAQDTTPYEPGSFTLQVPRGITMARSHAQTLPAMQQETFMGGNPRLGLLSVIHTSMRGLPQDSRLRTGAGSDQLLRDTAKLRAAVSSARDTSGAAERELRRMNDDTTVAGRREILRANRDVFRRGSRTITVPAEAREIVTENRITLRSPMTISLGADMPPLSGVLDASVPRRGNMELWIVFYANKAEVPGFSEQAARVLDTFQITGGPTTAPVAPQDE